MILTPRLGFSIRPAVNFWLKQSRNLRPSLKIGKDNFELTVDVRNFNKDEIRVKARPEYVVIEGKQEKRTKEGYVIRQFVRKFKLPKNCILEDMQSRYSSNGMLTISAPRKICEIALPCEKVVPISFDCEHKMKEEEPFVKLEEEKVDPCAKFCCKNIEESKTGDVSKKGDDKKNK